LLPYFITVSNYGDGRRCDDRELVREGNEHVIRARFADADFFVREDLKQPLDAYLPHLGTLVFQAQLGSMLDKTHRIYHLVEDLGEMMGLSRDDRQTAGRAAELAKADLVTKMVVEMTSLQGIMGRLRAAFWGT
jgi:glycyl-tRNA synthetase